MRSPYDLIQYALTHISKDDIPEAEGIPIGKLEGKAEGIPIGIRFVATNMLKMGISLNLIANATGLSESEINELIPIELIDS